MVKRFFVEVSAVVLNSRLLFGAGPTGGHLRQRAEWEPTWRVGGTSFSFAPCFPPESGHNGFDSLHSLIRPLQGRLMFGCVNWLI